MLLATTPPSPPIPTPSGVSRSTSKSVGHVQPLTAVATATIEGACEVVEAVRKAVQETKVGVVSRRMEAAAALLPAEEEAI